MRGQKKPEGKEQLPPVTEENDDQMLRILSEKWGIEFIERSEDEDDNAYNLRVSSLKKTIGKADKKAQLLVLDFYSIEEKLKDHCEKWNVVYERPVPDEATHETASRRRHMRTKIKSLIFQSIQGSVSFAVCDVVNRMVTDVCHGEEKELIGNAEEAAGKLHSNPAVIEAALMFEQGEALHTIETCQVCFETQPVFHVTKPDGEVSFKPWKTNRNGMCKRCQNDVTA